jgi:hypothetical protein
MKLKVETSAFGLPADALGPVAVRVRRPDGSVTGFALTPGGPGAQRGVFQDTDQEGPYLFECRARLMTPAGIPLTRSRFMTGFILPKRGGKDEPGKPPRRPPCDCKDRPASEDWKRLQRLLELLRGTRR